jgi:excisionase family DNA binding protein
LEIGMATTVAATRRQALMNIEQAADRLGVSVRHMRRLVSERRIPYLKWGHLLRFDPQDIDEWLEDHVVPVSRRGHS